MSRRSLYIFVVIIVCIIAIFTYYRSSSEGLKNRTMDIETYITKNISEISPKKEVLGGTFYIINIEAYEGVGIVEYEDGHVAYMADFTYTIDDTDGTITIDSFIIRE